jgi:hypothetical protein
MRKHRARRNLLAVCVLLALVAVGCSNPLEPPLGTPHMGGTWKGAAKNVALTLILEPVQTPHCFCPQDQGPITGGSYSDAALTVQGSITGGFYSVDACHCGQPVTDITTWSIAVYPMGGGIDEFGGHFTSSTTIVATVPFFSPAGARDSVTMTLVKQ